MVTGDHGTVIISPSTLLFLRERWGEGNILCPVTPKSYIRPLKIFQLAFAKGISEHFYIRNEC